MKRKKAASGIIALTVLGLSLTVAQGFKLLETSDTCQTTVKKCHGLPFDGCIGYESMKTTIEPKASCDKVNEIEQKCDQVGKELCEVNENDIGQSWAEKTEVYGFSCKTWNEEYSIELRSC